MSWKTLDDMELAGKAVLTRVDINVPVEAGRVTDDTRIQRVLPTIRDILNAGGKPVLMAHFGRPGGKPVPDLSLAQLRQAVETALGSPVVFCPETVGVLAAKAIADLPSGSTLMLENTRFNAGETSNNPEFIAALAALGDVYCNDAFSAAHRAHASTEGLAHSLPACAGRLMATELGTLEKALANPQHPVVAVVGGAKVSTKLDLLGNLLHKVDQIIIGGGMANTFLAAQGIDVGKSLYEHDLADTARDIMARAKADNCELVLPIDVVVAWEFAANTKNKTVAADACPPDAMILDAGPQSVAAIGKVFEAAKTLVWNGPLGAFEIEPFNMATDAAALKAGALTKAGSLLSVAGGGDTVAALNHSGAAADFTYISTAGGAFLEWLEGKTLPGVAALNG